jgi:hypothetical protein
MTWKRFYDVWPRTSALDQDQGELSTGSVWPPKLPTMGYMRPESD